MKWILVPLIFVCLVSCVVQPLNDDVDTFHQRFFEESTSREKLDAVTPKIRGLKVGQAIDVTGLSWAAHKITDGQKVYDLSVQSDGWINFLSGGLRGGLMQLGAPVGFINGKVIGRHIFGYSWSGVNVVPRFTVYTQAQLMPSDTPVDTLNVSDWTYHPLTKEKIYYSNTVVTRVVEHEDHLSHVFEEGQELKLGDSLKTDDYLATHLNEKAYEQISVDLESLPQGMPQFQVVQKLNGLIVKLSNKEPYVIMGIKGFLNNRDGVDNPIQTDSGLYMVWPFGYMNGEETVIKSVLIFKNNDLFKHVSYESDEQIRKVIESDRN